VQRCEERKENLLKKQAVALLPLRLCGKFEVDHMNNKGHVVKLPLTTDKSDIQEDVVKWKPEQ